MYKKEKLGLLLILVGFAAFFVMNGSHQENVQMYPYVVCVLGFTLTAVQLGVTVYKEKKEIPIDVTASLTKEQFMSVVVTLVSAFAYIYLASIIGYFTMTFIFVAGYSYWHTRSQKKWWYIAVAVGVCVVVYVAFKVFLKIPLPSGMLI